MRSRGLSIDGSPDSCAPVAVRRWVKLAIATFVLVISWTWLLSPALAHTDLLATRPADGEVVTEPVSRIEIEFSGALDPEGTSVRVLDVDGKEIPAAASNVGDALVVVEPERELDSGRFAVLWSARSASDGHELSGSFTFGVPTAAAPGQGANPDAAPAPVDATTADGAADGMDSETTSEVAPPPAPTVTAPPVANAVATATATALPGEDRTVSDFLEWLGRWLAMLGAIVGIGAIGFAATSLIGSPREVRRAASWIRLGGIMILVGSVVELTATATSQGHSLSTALMPWTWIDVLPTAQAYAMVLRIAGAIAMLQSPRLVLTSPGPPVSDPLRDQATTDRETGHATAVATEARTEPVRNRLEIQHEWVAIAGAAAVIASFGLDGHTADAGLIGRLASMAHVLAAGVWAGGLVVMADLLIHRSRSSTPTETAAVTIRFSRVASAALVLTAVAGGALAWSLVDEPSELWSGSWGRTLIAKLLLVAVAAAIGGYNHFRVVPRIDEPGSEAATTVSRTVAVEALLVLAVLAVTAVLVTAAP